MAEQSVTGKWQGRYMYGEGYGAFTGTTVRFQMDLSQQGNNFNGTCLDDETKDFFSASVEGSLENGYISFIKKYPYKVVADEDGSIKVMKDVPASPIHYTGRLRKMLFSRRVVFRGEWTITSRFFTGDGEPFYHTFKGKWSMEAAPQ